MGGMCYLVLCSCDFLTLKKFLEFLCDCYCSRQHLKESTSTAFQMLVEYEFHYGQVEHGKHQHTSVKDRPAKKRTKHVDCCMLADRYSHLQQELLKIKRHFQLAKRNHMPVCLNILNPSTYSTNSKCLLWTRPCTT